MTFGNEVAADPDQLVYRREDFLATTSNKQLNFLQHVMTLLGTKGRAAVVLPDSVLSEAGPGETIRRALLTKFDVHTLLRLPTGIFYAGSVKSSVLFFDQRSGRGEKRGGNLWTYDMRTGRRFSLRSDPLTDEALQDFVRRYAGPARTGRREEGPFRSFPVADILASDRCSLDLGIETRAGGAEELDPPAVIAAEIAYNLETAADAIRALEHQLGRR